MAWPAWPIDEDKALARYVLPEVGERVRITIVRDDEIKKGNRLAVVGAIYEALRNCDFRYGREKYAPEDGRSSSVTPARCLQAAAMQRVWILHCCLRASASVTSSCRS